MYTNPIYRPPPTPHDSWNDKGETISSFKKESLLYKKLDYRCPFKPSPKSLNKAKYLKDTTRFGHGLRHGFLTHETLF